MKILFVGGGIVGGGAERVTVTLANNFVEQGEEVMISCEVSRGFSYLLSNSVKLFDHRYGCDRTYLRKKIALFRFIHMLWNIRSLVKHFQPDIVIPYITTFNIYTLIALWGLKTPIIAMEHTNVSFDPGFRERILRNVLYSKAAAVTVLTQRDFSLWKNKFGGNVVYMPNPCETISQYKDVDFFSRRKVILGIGRVTDWQLKGFDNLIKCWCEICSEFPDWSLQIVGQTDEYSLDYLNSLVKENEGSNVEFLGFRQDVYDLLSDSQVYVLSSRREGLPMGLIEAMSFGCCCVAFDVITGPSEIITNCFDGILVDNQDNKSMIESLRMVLSQDELRKRLGNAAPEGVTRYSVSNVLKMWYSLFNKIGVV